MGAKKWRAGNKRDLIIEVWEHLDCESVGMRELKQIQQALRERFGDGAVESPASIARTVADEGAVLRHPEIFDYDRQWRERNLDRQSLAAELNFSNFSEALKSFAKLEKQREELKRKTDDDGLNRLRDLVSSARQNSLITARSKIIDENERDEAKEIAHWLIVWLQAPALFADWLDLRRRSPEFTEKFPGKLESDARP